MTERIQLQRSSTLGVVPDAADLKIGELTVNFADRTLWTKNASNAVLRLTKSIQVTDTPLSNPISGDWYLTTSGELMVYADLGGGETWENINAPTDISGLLAKSGGTMTGQITLPGGGTGSQAVTVTEATALAAAAVVPYLPKAGGTMTGQLTLPGGGSGSQALTATEIQALIDLAIPPDLADVVLKSGSVMTGQLTLPGGGTGNQAISSNELAAAIATHAAQPDPHTVYTLTTELNAHIAAGGAQHPVATTSVAGFMSSADKTRFDVVVAASTTELLTATDNTKYLTALGLKALYKKGTGVAGGATITFGEGGYFHITGTGWTCTDFDFTTSVDGRPAKCIADGAGTITHHATTLVCPGGANITVSAGDTWEVIQDDTDNVKIMNYQKADGTPLVTPATGAWVNIPVAAPSAVASVDVTGLSGYKAIRITGINVRPSSDDKVLGIRLSSDGSTYISGSNYSVRLFTATGDDTVPHDTGATSSFNMGNPANTVNQGNAAADGGMDFEVILSSFNIAQKTKIFGKFVFGDTTGAMVTGNIEGWHNSQTAMQALQLFYGGGTLTASAIYVEGLT